MIDYNGLRLVFFSFTYVPSALSFGEEKTLSFILSAFSIIPLAQEKITKQGEPGAHGANDCGLVHPSYY